jgi:hypothetical protein
MAGHEQDGAGQAVPVAEAAARLGLTPETLRKRLWRGQVQGEKRDGQWYVVLPEQDAAGPVRDTAGPRQDGAGPEQDREQDRQDEGGLAAQYIASLERMLAEQRIELEARRREVQELHILLQRAQQLALPAPNSPPTANGADRPNGTPAANSSPWWRRWWPWGSKGT